MHIHPENIMYSTAAGIMEVDNLLVTVFTSLQEVLFERIPREKEKEMGTFFHFYVLLPYILYVIESGYFSQSPAFFL